MFIYCWKPGKYRKSQRRKLKWSTVPSFTNKSTLYWVSAQFSLFRHTCGGGLPAHAKAFPALGLNQAVAYLMSWWYRATAISSGSEVSLGRKLILEEEAGRQG